MPPFAWDDLTQFKATGRFLDGVSPDYRTFWSPLDNIHGLLMALLSSSTKSLVLNMYGYDDTELDTIIRNRAASPGFYVQMSLDSSQAGGVAERAILEKWSASTMGTSIAIGQSTKHAISHLKVCIIDGIYTISGSTNWSVKGEGAQDNELTLSRDPVRAADYRSVLDRNHDAMLKQMAAKGRG